MTETTITPDLYWDPYDPDLFRDPYPTYRRMREEAPLYYNEKHDFYALTRADDIEQAYTDRNRLINGRSDIIEYIKSGVPVPAGHGDLRGSAAPHPAPGAAVTDVHPEDGGRPRAEDPWVLRPGPRRAGGRRELRPGERLRQPGADAGHQPPFRCARRTAGDVPRLSETHTRGEEGKPPDSEDLDLGGGIYEEYIDWRAKNPSDDMTTHLLTTEFEDDHGVVRCLTRQELLAYFSIISGAGNETTAKLIGWTGQLLGAHPDQRRDIVEDRSLLGPRSRRSSATRRSDRRTPAT